MGGEGGGKERRREGEKGRDGEKGREVEKGKEERREVENTGKEGCQHVRLNVSTLYTYH